MITSLAYVGIESPNGGQWPEMVRDVWGGQITEPGPDGAVRVKIDEMKWRIQIHPAQEDRVAYLGWAVAREEDLDDVASVCAELGIECEIGDAELAQERCVDRLVAFTDPWGFRHEVTWGQHAVLSSFTPARPMTGFVTGIQGLGHALLLIPDIEAGHEFFRHFGFRLSDKIIVPGRLNARFYHCGLRHHSLALGQGPPGVAGLNHIMIQAGDIDDVGTAYELAEEHDIPITLTIGRHSNDRQFSFYHSTPSSFHVEYGWGGLEVVDEDWVPRVYDRTAVWGHKPHPSGSGRPPGAMHPLADPEVAPVDVPAT